MSRPRRGEPMLDPTVLIASAGRRMEGAKFGHGKGGAALVASHLLVPLVPSRHRSGKEPAATLPRTSSGGCAPCSGSGNVANPGALCAIKVS